MKKGTKGSMEEGKGEGMDEGKGDEAKASTGQERMPRFSGVLSKRELEKKKEI